MDQTCFNIIFIFLNIIVFGIFSHYSNPKIAKKYYDNKNDNKVLDTIINELVELLELKSKETAVVKRTEDFIKQIKKYINENPHQKHKTLK